MPQSSLRSAVYRSLVPCDDPNGVVENKTIRKSKNRSKKIEQGIESQRVKKESTSLSSIFIKEGSNGVSSKGIREELLDIPPSFELLEVSRGAQKLNEMIDSWSRGISFDGQSNEIARDLLKGALDLQKSLSMLCKLQETSNYKQNQKLDQGNLERNGSNRFTEKNYPKAFQNQRLSIDGASRNCVEELRTVIKESLSRQNLLPVPLSDGKFDSVSDIPSTSSSQSSADWSVSSGAQHRKTSVIAKLMGLEEFPSAPIQISQKQFETEKILSPRRPIFEIERPNTKKSYFLDRNEDPKRRTLKEVIETMRLNGLLKSRNIDGFKLWSHFTPSHSKQRLDDESPPIVIMKPMCFTSNDTEGKFSRQSSRNEGAMHFTEKLRNAEVREEPLVKRYAQDEKCLGFEEMLQKLEAKDASPTKSKSKELRIPDKSSNKMKASAVPNHKPHKKEIVMEKAQKTQKVPLIKRKTVEKEKEKEKEKSKTVSRSQDQKRKTSTRPRKIEDEPVITKKCVTHQNNTEDRTFKHSIPLISKSSVDPKEKGRMRKGKPLRESKTVTSTKNQQSKDSGVEIYRADKIDSISTTSNILHTVQSLAKEEVEATEVEIEDHSGEQGSSLCLISPPINEHCSFAESAEEPNKLIDNKPEPWKTSRTESPLKGLFLSNPSFLSHAEYLFDLNINQPILSQPITIEDHDTMDTKLIMNCANELMERKGVQVSQWDHPILRTRIPNPRNNISINKLVNEVCEGVDNLRSYIEKSHSAKPADSFIKMLETDLMGKGMMVGGVWDLGWVNGLCVTEADQVVGEVGKQVLDELINEVLQDFHDTWIQQLIYM